MKKIGTVFGLLSVFFASAQIPLKTSSYSQNFDSLASTGTSSKLPNGWYMLETGTNADTTYGTGTGSATTGNTYSFGPSGSIDRALGSLSSASLISTYGAWFVNKSGTTIESITISFYIEQWRLGATGRFDSTILQYSTDANNLVTGTWKYLPNLCLYTLTPNGIVGATDGNLSTNRMQVSYTLNNLKLAPGGTFFLRWTDRKITGSNDGLAVDDFSIKANLAKKVYFSQVTASVNEKTDSAFVYAHIINADSNATSVSISIDPTSTASAADYFLVKTTASFPAKSSDSVKIGIKIVNDKLKEGPETLILRLKNPTGGAILGDSIFTLTILDDDLPKEYKVKELKSGGMTDTSISGIFHLVASGPSLGISAPIQFPAFDSTGVITVESMMKILINVKAGDSVYVRGKVKLDSFLAVIDADSISIISSGNTVYSPINVNSLDESHESVIVTVDNLSLDDPSQWTAARAGAGDFFTVFARSSSNVFQIRISKNSGLFGSKPPHGIFNITGVEWQAGNTANSGYYIAPRELADIRQKPVKLYNIGQIKGYNTITGIPDSMNVYCMITGIVNSSNLKFGAMEFAISDRSGSIMIESAGPVTGYQPTPGDSIVVSGTVSENNGLIIFIADSISKTGIGKPISYARIVTALDETTESVVVGIRNLRLTDLRQWDTTAAGNKSFFTVTATDGISYYSIRISRTTDLYFRKPVLGTFNISGIGSQYDLSLSNPFTGYILIPRGSVDLQVIQEPKIPKYLIRQVKGYNLITGVADSIGTVCELKGVVYSANLETSGLEFSIQDTTGGIVVQDPSSSGSYTPKLGDSIHVRGVIRQYEGLTLIQSDSIIRVGPGLLYDRLKVAQLEERYESRLVSIDSVMLLDTAKWNTFSDPTGFTVRVVKGDDTIPIRVLASTTLFNRAIPKHIFSIAGIEVQYDQTQPYFQGYLLVPRRSEDLVEIFGAGIVNKDEKGSIGIYPNPAIERIMIQVDEIKTVSIFNNMGQLEWKGKVEPGSAIDISDLKPGIYFLSVGNQSFRFIKE